jgi:hypothetical protein
MSQNSAVSKQYMSLNIFVIHLSVRQSVCPSVIPSICPVYLSECLSAYPSVYLSIYPSFYPSVCLSVCQPVNASKHQSVSPVLHRRRPLNFQYPVRAEPLVFLTSLWSAHQSLSLSSVSCPSVHQSICQSASQFITPSVDTQTSKPEQKI